MKILWGIIMNDKSGLLRKYLLLYFGIFIYSLSSLFGKTASFFPIQSIQFFLIYGCSLSFLVLYALLWQQVLKRFPLTTAYANRSLATVLGMLWGIFFFGEKITGNMIIGTILIIMGIQNVVKANEL